MPSKNDHIDQYKKNKELAQEKLLCENKHNDWKVTILYYAVIHVIESSYAQNNIHFTSHFSRNKFLNSSRRHADIIDMYDNLEMLSRRARYDCDTIKPRNVRDAEAALKEAETLFIS